MTLLKLYQSIVQTVQGLNCHRKQFERERETDLTRHWGHWSKFSQRLQYLYRHLLCLLWNLGEEALGTDPLKFDGEATQARALSVSPYKPILPLLLCVGLIFSPVTASYFHLTPVRWEKVKQRVLPLSLSHFLFI